jgi:hypothetical protein
MPDQQSFWQNPDLKVYATEIWLGGDTSALRTGMTCRAEVIVEQHQDAAYVPVQAVVRVNGKPTVYVVPGTVPNAPPQAREIDLGLDNNRMAHVKSGLNAGEVVLLNPPLPEPSGNASEQTVATPTTMPAIALPTTRPGGGAVTPGGGRGSGRGGRGDAVGAGAGGRGGQSNLTAEEREERRKKFEAMSPEEKAKMMEQLRKAREQSGGDDAGGGPGSGGGAGPSRGAPAPGRASPGGPPGTSR